MEDKMTERVFIVMTREHKELLEALAEANTGENISMMMRRLIEIASRKPKTIGLHPPKALAPSLN